MKVVDSSFRWNDNCTHEILRPDISGLRMTVVCTLLTMTLTYKSMQEKTLETAKKNSPTCACKSTGARVLRGFRPDIIWD